MVAKDVGELDIISASPSVEGLVVALTSAPDIDWPEDGSAAGGGE
jgi:hypothetical protein